MYKGLNDGVAFNVSSCEVKVRNQFGRDIPDSVRGVLNRPGRRCLRASIIRAGAHVV
jgi:hypothetical protein